MKKHLTTGLAAVVVLAMSARVFAQPTVEEQETEIASLKARLAVIETQMKEQQIERDKTNAELKKKAKAPANDFTFYGDARVRAIDSGDGYGFEQRVRLNLEKKVNYDMTFKMRAIMMDENELGTTGTDDVKSKIDIAYMKFNHLYGDSNSSLKIGRFGQSFGKTGYWSSEGSLGMYDGVEFMTGNKLKVTAGFGDWGGAKNPAKVTTKVSGNKLVNSSTDLIRTTPNKLEKNVYIKLAYDPSPATSLQVWHIRETNADSSPLDYEVTGLGVASHISKNLFLDVDYSKNVAIDGDPVGKFVTLTYGKARYNKPHSYETRLYYADVDKGNVPGTSNKSINIPCNDVKGLGLSLHYVVSKGVMTEFLTEFNAKQKSTDLDKDNYYRFQVTTKF